MRRLPLIAAAYTATAALAACSTATSSAPAAAVLSGAHQTCASTMQAWLHGPGGGDLHAALTAGSVMGAALETGSLTRVTGAAPGLDSAASRAVGQLPPACADRGAAYRIAMRDWMTGAADAKDGNLQGTSSKIATGARVMDAVTTLQRLSPTVLKDLSRPVPIPTGSAPPPPPPPPPASSAPPAPATTAAQPTAPPPAPTQPAPTQPAPATSAAPAGCHPLSDEGTCYEPGEYCRDADHGMSGVAGDGKAITCEDNDGWRWEPS
jgi:hypothetical protein